MIALLTSAEPGCCKGSSCKSSQATPDTQSVRLQLRHASGRVYSLVCVGEGLCSGSRRHCPLREFRWIVLLRSFTKHSRQLVEHGLRGDYTRTCESIVQSQERLE